MRKRLIRAMSFTLAVIAAGAGAYAENGITLKVTDKPIPADLPDDVKAQLTTKCLEVADVGGVFYEFWLVPGLTASGFADTTKESMDKIEEISLLGVAVVTGDTHHDFRDDPIDPGTYTMRLALQPKDGNHMGTAPFDTFAILIPANLDEDLKKFHDHDTMVELASEGTIAEHPPILSLQPIEEATGEFPRVEPNPDHEWTFIYLKMPVDANGEKKDFVFGLVVEGIGEL